MTNFIDPFEILRANIKDLQQKNTKILVDANILSFRKRKILLEELLPIMQHHKIGFIDKNGNVVIQPVYDDFKGKSFSRVHTSVCVKKNNKWGIIASDGHTIADFEYDFIFPSISYCTNYQENNNYFKQLYTVCKNHQWGVLKIDGSIFIEFGKYDWIDGYDSGLVRVKENEKWGMIDYMGQIALPVEYDNIWNFYNRNRGDTIIEKNGTQSYVKFRDLLSKYDTESEHNKFDITELEISEFNKTLSAQPIRSIEENPYYNENLDLDQQDPEFWESL